MTDHKLPMGVYSLANAHYLYYDINHVLTEIYKLYEVKYTDSETSAQTKMNLGPNIHWASDKSKETFNSILPKIKSLHQSMYALIESIAKDQEGDFKKHLLEQVIPNLKEFRLLNNQFKHFSETSVKIDVISMNYPLGDITMVDVNCQFQYADGKFELIPWGNFIVSFLKVLERYNLITHNI
jgi:hypothetical protein